MPIPFQDAEEIEELGNAAYLRIVSQDSEMNWLAALFTINARGEPVEFTYNRIETPHTFLWRAEQVRRFAARKLTTSLFRLCPESPRLILCMANEVGSELFGRDIRTSVPVCRVAPATVSASYSAAEEADTLTTGEPPLNLFWTPAKPPDDSPGRRLLNELVSRGLAVEPFERALRGLREVYRVVVAEEK